MRYVIVKKVPIWINTTISVPNVMTPSFPNKLAALEHLMLKGMQAECKVEECEPPIMLPSRGRHV